MLGNWSDSAIVDETKIFFEEIAPEYLPKISKFTDRNISDISELLSLVKNSIPNSLLGLLNITLQLRYFHPKASIRNPLEGKMPTLRGYSISFPYEIPERRIEDLHWKLLTLIEEEAKTKEEKFELYSEAMQNFPYIYNDITDRIINKTIISNYLNAHQTIPLSPVIINGKPSDYRPHNVINSLLNEYKLLKTLKRLNLNEDQINYLEHNIIFNQTVIQVSPPNRQLCSAKIRDIERGQDSEYWPSEINISNTRYPPIYVRKNLISFDVFTRLFDKNSLPILDLALDELSIPLPMGIFVYPIFNLANETERRAAFAFYNIEMKKGSRFATIFLRDSLKKGYEKAYNKQKVSPSYNLLDGLMVPELPIFNKVTAMNDYLIEHEIEETSCFVNGNPLSSFQGDTLLKEVTNSHAYWVQKITSAIREKQFTTIDEFLGNTSVPVRTLNLSLFKENQEFFEFDKLTFEEKYSFVRHCINHQDGKHLPVMMRERNESLISSMENVSIYIVPDLPYILMIGALTFKEFPSPEEASVAVKIHHFNFAQDLDNFTQEQKLFIILWRASETSIGIKRPKCSDNPFKVSKGNGEIELELYMDPFDPIFPDASALCQMIAESGAAKASIVPLYRTLDELPAHLHDVYKQVLTVDSVPFSSVYTLHYPKEWITVRHGDSFVVQGFAFMGTANASIVQIGDQIRCPRKEDDFFVMTLPVGVYDAKGITQKKVYVDSFIFDSHPFVGVDENVEIEKETDKLNVFSFIVGPEYEDQTLTMMHCLQSNSSIPVKFWIVGTFLNLNPVGFDIEYLPLIFPLRTQLPSDEVTKLKFAKLVMLGHAFPPSIDTVLFVDPGVIFRGDPARFKKLNLTSAVIAMPDKSSDAIRVKSFYFAEKQYKNERAGRPFHSTSLFYANLTQWRDIDGNRILLSYYEKMKQTPKRVKSIDNDIINQAQLEIQVLTLPEETCLCPLYTNPNKAKDALAIELCSSSAGDLLEEGYSKLNQNAMKGRTYDDL